MNGAALINQQVSKRKVEKSSKTESRTNGYMEFILISQKIQLRKSNSREPYFDISKYAQMEKVLVGRNMLRYDHMDECGIGTDCILLEPKFSVQNIANLKRV